MPEIFDPRAADKAQEEYCETNGCPHFAPNWRVGYLCYHCKQNIYRGSGKDELFHKIVPGYSVEYASTHLITGCPFCHASYCE